MNKGTISSDFDGVLHDYADGWTGYRPAGKAIEGSLEFVGELIAEGYEVIVSSCRAYTLIGRVGIADWLLEYGFPRLEVTCEKPHAIAYIDDRAHRFEGDFGALKTKMLRPVWFSVPKEPEFGG